MLTTRIQQEIERHSAVIDFLIEHEQVIDSLSEQRMSEKFPNDDDVPHVSFWTSPGSIMFTVRGPGQRETMRALRRAIGGTWDKGGYGDRFNLTRYISYGNAELYVTIQGERNEVCQKVVTGVKEVQHEAVKAVPAHTTYEDEIEWVCGNLLDD